MNTLIGFLLGLFGFIGIRGFYVYLCQYYTIEKVKKLELQLSKLENITDEEINLLESVREFLIKTD